MTPPRPNPSLNPRPATAGTVSLACGPWAFSQSRLTVPTSAVGVSSNVRPHSHYGCAPDLMHLRQSFACPSCGGPLKLFPVICSGPLTPSTCPTCRKRYFGGGGPWSGAWFFAGFLLAFAVGPLTPYPREVAVLCVLAGFLLSVVHALRRPLVTIERRRRELVASALLTVGAAALLVVIIMAR